METKKYRIGRLPHFMDGVLRGEGTIVEIPADQEPAPGWTLVQEAPSKTETPEPEPEVEVEEEVEVGGVKLRRGGRAADRKL